MANRARSPAVRRSTGRPGHGALGAAAVEREQVRSPKRPADSDRRAGVQLRRNAVHRLLPGGGSFADRQNEPVLEVAEDGALARKGEIEEDDARLARFERPGRLAGAADQQQRQIWSPR
jgi:hypothetical protein